MDDTDQKHERREKRELPLHVELPEIPEESSTEAGEQDEWFQTDIPEEQRSKPYERQRCAREYESRSQQYASWALPKQPHHEVDPKIARWRENGEAAFTSKLYDGIRTVAGDYITEKLIRGNIELRG